LNSPCFINRDLDIRGSFIQTYANLFKFSNQFPFLVFSLGCIQNHEHQIGGFSHCYNLSSSTSTFTSSLDNTRKIQKLDFAVIVLDHTWNACQSCELVSRYQRLRLSYRSQQS
jgi:hypothetical protein